MNAAEAKQMAAAVLPALAAREAEIMVATAKWREKLYTTESENQRGAIVRAAAKGQTDTVLHVPSFFDRERFAEELRADGYVVRVPVAGAYSRDRQAQIILSWA
jgi:hypothetical protein